MSTRMEQAAALAATSWRAFKIDPIWCMQYLFFMEKFLRGVPNFTAEQPLQFVIACGISRPDSLSPAVWCDGFDLILRLGWISKAVEKRQGSTCWNSLLKGE